MIKNTEEELKRRGVEVPIKSNKSHLVLKWKKAFHAISFIQYVSTKAQQMELRKKQENDSEESQATHLSRRASIKDLFLGPFR